MSAATASGAPRAAALLAALALAGGAAPRTPGLAPCPSPRFAWPEGGIAQATCPGRLDAAHGAASTHAAGLLFGVRLDPNRAAPEALEALPGVGPVRAAAIAQEARRRPFCRSEDLERVPGIGPVTRARLAPWVEPRAGGCAE